MKVLVLLSGGMDSVAVLYHARESHEIVAAVTHSKLRPTARRRKVRVWETSSSWAEYEA